MNEEYGLLIRRAAIHGSLVALYGLGGYLVSRGLMPLRVLLSAIGFTFSLVFATQGCVQTFSDAQRALVSLARSAFLVLRSLECCHSHIGRLAHTVGVATALEIMKSAAFLSREELDSEQCHQKDSDPIFPSHD